MHFDRVYTDGITSPFDTIKWENRTVEIREENGNLVFVQTDVEVPDFWDEVATSMLANKYFRRAKVPAETIKVPEQGVFDQFCRSIPKEGTTFGGEHSLRQVAHRLVGNWVYWMCRENHFDTEEDANVFYDEMIHILINQIAEPNSPQFFNTGLGWAYGNNNNYDGYFFIDEKTGKALEYEKNREAAICRQQAQACFILNVKDSMFGEESIYDTLMTEAKIFKGGSGAGANFSNLRGAGESLSSGGTSSGVMSFLKILDRSADSVKSGGVSRRAAKMVILDIDHPEVEDFIDWKLDEEQKVAAMISGAMQNSLILNKLIRKWNELGENASKSHKEIKKIVKEAMEHSIEIGYIQRAIDLAIQGKSEMPFIELTNNFNDDAYHTVSGQNSNNSISITDAFMKSLESNAKWQLKRRTDGKTAKEINAKMLWDKIGYAAWSSADPGVIFKDTMNAWNTCSNDGEIVATNPCGEYNFLNSTACNLSSARLTKFYENGKFDVDKFAHVCRMFAVVLEISVTSAMLPTKSMSRGTYNYRTLGMGYCDVGALMMIQGIPYDSPEAMAQIGAITALMTGQVYLASTEMAKEVGPFARYAENKDSMLRVLRNHRRALIGDKNYEKMNVSPVPVDKNYVPAEIYGRAVEVWNKLIENAEQYGVRNAFVTVLAPTGSIGLLMGADTTGIEPDFSLVKYKKLSGGGYIRIINRSVPEALAKLGYNEKQIQDITNYIVGSGRIPEVGEGITAQSLKNNGINDVCIESINSTLISATSITQAFNKWTLGENYCTSLGFPVEELSNPEIGSMILDKMGYSKEQIEEASALTCGHGTIEGAPYVSLEHYPVFDCAVPSGKYGSRQIHYMGHLRAVAAAQPFLSGASSKTINMSKNATIEEIQNCYAMAYKLGIKCVALYRDSCKLSQPMNTISEAELFDFSDIAEDESFIAAIREKLPAKRYGQTHEFHIGPFGGPYHKIFLRTGEYSDGRLGEIFINYAEEDAFARTLLDSFARAVSIGLQRGVPKDEYFALFRSISQDPSGQVLHPNVKVAKSIFDAIGKILQYEYNGDDDAVEMPSPREESTLKTSGRHSNHMEFIHVAEQEKASLKQCKKCGGTDMVQTSSCTMRCRRCNTALSEGCGG